MREHEKLIFIRGKWEIAHKETDRIGKTNWIRRDQSWICAVGDEEGMAPLPPKPSRGNGHDRH